MSKEAMKLALEAFSVIAISDNLDWIRHQAKQQATYLRKALAEQPCDSKYEQDCTACNAQEALLAEQSPVPQDQDYAWPTVADYEKDVGFEVNQAFKMAWNMARTTNSFLNQIAGVTQQPAQQQKPDAIGCKCSECGEWQRWTPSGMVCKNGHGGAQGINCQLYTSPQPAQQEPVAWRLWDEDPLGGTDNRWAYYDKSDFANGVDPTKHFKVEPLYTSPPAQQQEADHEFKNFHRTMCERFGYTHDERDWKRDQVSLIEWIAKKVKQPALEQQGPVAWATQLNEYAHIKWGAKRPEYPMVYEFPLYTSPQPPAQQEPVDIEHCLWARNGNTPCPHTSTPAQRKPLTLGQKQKLWSSVGHKPTLKDRVNAYGFAIEAAHGIKE